MIDDISRRNVLQGAVALGTFGYSAPADAQDTGPAITQINQIKPWVDP